MTTTSLPHAGEIRDSVDNLWRAERKLTLAVINSVRAGECEPEERFFSYIRRPLDELCGAIATHIGCQSAAAYFVNQQTEGDMRMRGAFGNHRWVLDGGPEAPGAFYTRPESATAGLNVADAESDVIKQWRLTVRAWVLGRAYIVNTRRDLEHLADRPLGGKGSADDVTYNPGKRQWAMRNVFSSLLCIPVFARGASQSAFIWSEVDGEHAEFLDRYHVVGLLKLEGRLPEESEWDWEAALEGDAYAGDREEIRRRITHWMRTTGLGLGELMGGAADVHVDADGNMLPLCQVLEEANQELLEDTSSKGTPWKAIVDFLTAATNARFTWDDAEVVVAIAMQLGRLLALRVMQRADQYRMLLDENVVGALDIRYQDVLPLSLLMKAAKHICQKVDHELRILAHQMEDEGRRDWETLRPGSPYEHRSPIRDTKIRSKELGSLLTKVMDRALEAEARPDQADDGFGRSKAERWPLVRRIIYLHKVDDLSGIRVVCPYLSDVNRVLDAMQAHFPAAGITFDRVKVDRFLGRPRKGGYRAVHLTVSVDTHDLLNEVDREALADALGRGRHSRLRLPCEIQLLTEYQHSWSQASHELIYKSESDMPRDLREHLRILSELLFQADQSADLVRSGVIRVIEGDDYGRSALLDGLQQNEERARRLRGRERGHPGDEQPVDQQDVELLRSVSLVEFAVRCAQLAYRDKFRHGGRPYVAHAIAVARTLLEAFEVDDPDMLAAALLHDLWMDPAYALSQNEVPYWREILERSCASVVSEFGGRLTLKRSPARQHADPTVAAPAEWMDDLMGFLARAWAKEHREDRLYRIRQLAGEHPCDLVRGIRDRAVLLECAIVASRFSELTFLPSSERAFEQFEENYQSLERLVPLVADSRRKRRVSRACERMVREAARQLGVTMPIQWSQ